MGRGLRNQRYGKRAFLAVARPAPGGPSPPDEALCTQAVRRGAVREADGRERREQVRERAGADGGGLAGRETARPGALPQERRSERQLGGKHRLYIAAGAGAADRSERHPDPSGEGNAGGRDRGRLPFRPCCRPGKPHELPDGAGPLQRESEEALRPGWAHISIRH